MAFQVEGKLHRVFDTEQKTETFRAREFVIEVADGQYPQMIKFQLTQDRCDLIESHTAGDEILVHFDLRGREWNDKYFTNLNAWRIESAGQANAGAGQAAAAPANPAPAASSQPAKVDDFEDDIPF